MDQRPIEGKVVDSGEPAYYVGPRPWYARLFFWFNAKPMRRSAAAWIAAIVLFGPAFALGIWYVVGVALFFLGLAVGWSLARRQWLDEGYIDDL